MADNFSYHPVMLHSPGEIHRVITPNDAADLDPRPRALIALTSGTIAIRDERGTDITYPVLAGQPIEFRAVRVLATGTTATVAAWE